MRIRLGIPARAIGPWMRARGCPRWTFRATPITRPTKAERGGRIGGSVLWDYSATPRLVDVPVIAFAHLCIPHGGRMEPRWPALAGNLFPPESETCTEDLDGDGLVTVADLLMVLGAFGQACD